MKDLLQNPYFIKTTWAIVTIFISWFFYMILSKIIIRTVEGERVRILNSKKSKTYMKLIRSIMRYIFIICTFLFVLQIYGINVSRNDKKY